MENIWCTPKFYTWFKLINNIINKCKISIKHETYRNNTIVSKCQGKLIVKHANELPQNLSIYPN